MIKYQYHYADNIEYSAIYDFSQEFINKYFIFIKFDNKNKMYIDIKGLGSIIMHYEQFIENENLKKYYELSLKLSKNKNYIIEKNYDRKEDWFLDCAYIVENHIEKGKYYCYCNINPYILKKMNVSSHENIKKYLHKFSILLSEDNTENPMCVNNIIHILPYLNNIISMYKKYFNTSYYDKIEKLITKYSIDLDTNTDSHSD
jgi:hypothetical protein